MIHGGKHAIPKMDLLRFGQLLWSKGTPGKEGSGNGEFNHPTTIAVNQHGDIHVVDRGNSRVQVFNYQGVFKHTFGTKGTGNGEFNNPFCVATNSKDEIIVSDTDSARVQIFTSHGKFLHAFTSTACSGPWHPMGVVVSNNDKIIVVDTENEHSIQTFNPDGTLFVKFDAESGPFTGHKYVAVDKRNNKVFITDTQRECLRVFAEDGSLLETWPYKEPFDVAVAPDGHILMLDNNSGFKLFDEKFTFIRQFDRQAFHHTSQASAMGIAFDPRDGTVTVAEATFHMIHKFGYYPH